MSETKLKTILLEGISPIVSAIEESEAYYDMGYFRYPLSLLTEAILEYNATAPHFEPSNEPIHKFSHMVEKVQIDADGIMRTKIQLIETPQGRVIKDLIDAGVIFHTTLSCHGVLDGNNNIINAENLSISIEPDIMGE